METVARALPTGTLIHGRYQILKVLGAGGFGVTYQAVDRKDGLVVALKEYMPIDTATRRPGRLEVFPQNGSQENYERFRNRFLEEAKLMYQYREHPNIIQVKHLFYENNTAYYVMEYMEGMDLQKVLEKKKRETRYASINWSELSILIAQAVDALEVVHRSGTVHCDISPDNLFILQNGQLKLIDFGAAKKLMKGPSSIILLKRGFSPPEQFTSSGRIGPWTDIYALAVTIYVCFTGKMPPSAPDRLAGAVVESVSSIYSGGIALPTENWEKVLQKAMALRVEERYQNVREFWNDLMRGEYVESTCPLSKSIAWNSYAVEESQKSVFHNPMGGRKIPMGLALEGVQGYFQGNTIAPPSRDSFYFQRNNVIAHSEEKELIFGIDASRCQICYPSNTPGVSRVHMRIWSEEENLYAMDMGSTYGTFLNGQRMTVGLVYELREGMFLQFGNGQVFRVVMQWRTS